MRDALTPSRTLIRFGAILQPDRGPSAADREADMLDLIYLALGIGVFALFAGYAALLRRI